MSEGAEMGRLSAAANYIDSLRILALGRIPRCTRCPRYRELARRERKGPLPPVPPACNHQVCAPLVARFDALRGPAAAVRSGAGDVRSLSR